jgi:N-acetylated-alpha-linked acidic dipeptidase
VGEQHDAEMAHAVAYFNMDVAWPVQGLAHHRFQRSSSSCATSRKRSQSKGRYSLRCVGKIQRPNPDAPDNTGTNFRSPASPGRQEAAVGDLGSGSDYTVFLQHLGVPSTDVGSTGSYGVYHSVFDNFIG